MFQNLEYGEADFKTEARAVLGEYNKNSAEPLRKFFEVQREKFFQKHTYKHTTMGFIADIENMPNQYGHSRTFFERWYRPENTTIIVAGDVTPETTLPVIEKAWGGWKTGTAAPPAIPQETSPAGPFYAHVPWPTDTPPYVSVAFLGPAFDEKTKDTAAFEMLDTLYFGSTSDLYKKLVVTEQKVDQLIGDTPASVDASLYTVLVRVKNLADALYARSDPRRSRPRARPVPAARLADAKSNSRYGLSRTLDSTERIASIVSAFAGYHRTSRRRISTTARSTRSSPPISRPWHRNTSWTAAQSSRRCRRRRCRRTSACCRRTGRRPRRRRCPLPSRRAAAGPRPGLRRRRRAWSPFRPRRRSSRRPCCLS